MRSALDEMLNFCTIRIVDDAVLCFLCASVLLLLPRSNVTGLARLYDPMYTYCYPLLLPRRSRGVYRVKMRAWVRFTSFISKTRNVLYALCSHYLAIYLKNGIFILAI